MALNDVHRLSMVTSVGLGVAKMYNTFWFVQTIADPAGDDRAVLANDFLGTMITPVSNSFRAIASNVVAFNEVRVQKIVPYEESVFSLPIAGNPVGASATTPLPPLCATCVTIFSERGGRSGRGRFYLPPTSASQQSLGLWISTYLTFVDQAMSAFSNRYAQLSGYSVSGFRAGVWSKKFGGSIPLTQLIGFSPMTGWLARPEVRGINRRSRLHD